MTIFVEGDKVCVKCSGDLFLEQVDTCRSLSMKYDPKTKVWTTHISKYNTVIDNFLHYSPEISEHTLTQLRNWKSTLNELEIKTSRKDYRKFNLDLLTMPPTK